VTAYLAVIARSVSDEAIQLFSFHSWIASSQVLLAMTVSRGDNAWLICPTGCFATRLSSPVCKNISVFPKSKSGYIIRHPVPHRGALRNVTSAGRDAVDAEALSDEGR
jgi:hypothetical protein